VTVDLQEVSRTLFAAADQLWTNTALRRDQCAQPVLALIALRQMEAKFEKGCLSGSWRSSTF
jgi:type I restriction enzyme M protein